MARGARNFVFLGRSGTDKKNARLLVDELEYGGAHVKVVRGDASNFNDVQKLADEADSPIGGVIQAAMGLDVSGLPHCVSSILSNCVVGGIVD